MTDNPDYAVILRPLADGVPGPVRLRRYLKLALRGYRLRCVRVEAIAHDDKTTEGRNCHATETPTPAPASS
jgi:hypothetical protein